MEACQSYLYKGKCKYGESCRNGHEKTLVRLSPLHVHPIGPDDASKRKKFFCDQCNQKSSFRWRCTEGCDYDLCTECFEASIKEGYIKI